MKKNNKPTSKIHNPKSNLLSLQKKCDYVRKITTTSSNRTESN